MYTYRPNQSNHSDKVIYENYDSYYDISRGTGCTGTVGIYKIWILLSKYNNDILAVKKNTGKNWSIKYHGYKIYLARISNRNAGNYRNNR